MTESEARLRAELLMADYTLKRTLAQALGELEKLKRSIRDLQEDELDTFAIKSCVFSIGFIIGFALCAFGAVLIARFGGVG